MAKKPSKEFQKKRLQTQLLLEHNKQGQRRIVIIGVDGVPDNSKWFETHEVANFKGYFSVQDYHSRLPHQSLFRISICKHELLQPVRYKHDTVALATKPQELNDE